MMIQTRRTILSLLVSIQQQLTDHPPSQKIVFGIKDHFLFSDPFTMKFSAVIFSLALTSASGALRADSEVGQSLLSKARQLDQNNNYYYSWIQDYSIKFTGCAAVPQFEREEGVRSNLLAKFKMCPSDKCGRCPNAGEYVVDMRDFVEAYQQAKEAANEATCEAAEYKCETSCQNGEYAYNGNNNNNGGDGNDYCSYQCLVDQGLGYCAQEDDDANQNNVDMDQFGECRAMNEDNNNNNNGYNNGNTQIYYTGAFCTSKGIYAGVFTDSACTKKAPSGTYEKYNYGYSLPSEPLVETDCISCLDSANNNNNNNNGNNNVAISETCEKLYEQSAKCEKNVKTQYQDNSSCELIHKTIPRLNASLNGLTAGPTAKIFAWIFGITVLFMGWYIYRLHKILGSKAGESGTSFNLMGTSA